MNAYDFIAKWGPGGPGHALNERQGAQQHFIELCALGEQVSLGRLRAVPSFRTLEAELRGALERLHIL